MPTEVLSKMLEPNCLAFRYNTSMKLISCSMLVFAAEMSESVSPNMAGMWPPSMRFSSPTIMWTTAATWES